MKFLQMVSSPYVNGAIIHAARFTKLLQSAGHEVVLAAPEDSWIAGELAGRCELIPTHFHRHAGELQRLADLCRTHAIDVTHSHLTRAHNFGWQLERRSRRPHLAHHHSHHWRLHWCFQRRVLVLSAAAAREMRRTYLRRREQVAVLPNYADTHRFAPVATRTDLLAQTFGLPADAQVVVCVAELIPRKGQRYLIQALAAVRRALPRVHLLLLGRDAKKPDYARALRAEAAQLGLTAHITWGGFRDDVPALLPHAQVAVLPSLEEPFALGGLESMACGLPLIATRVGGFPEMIAPGETGLLVPSRDAARLAEALIDVLGDPARGQAWGRAARTRVLQHFSAPAHLANFEAILRQWHIETAATAEATAPRRSDRSPRDQAAG